MFDKTVIEKIEELSKPEVITIEERPYTTRPVHAVKQPQVARLVCRNLSSIVDYVKDNRDNLELKDLIIHIEAFDTVRLVSKFSKNYKERDAYIEASIKDYTGKHNFGTNYEQERFIISLQTNFEETETSKKILKFVGSVKSGTVTDATDDGVTQKVAIKTGVTLLKSGEVPNPVTLKPFRTFCEIDQPESLFVLRAFNTEIPSFALFEADGGKWKHEAIISIKKYFNEKLKDIAVIA